jgi:hypothetical protein
LNMQALKSFSRRARKTTLNYAATCLKLVDTLRFDKSVLKYRIWTVEFLDGHRPRSCHSEAYVGQHQAGDGRRCALGVA